MAFLMFCPAFVEGEAIPSRFTCDGRNQSPGLIWSNPPAGTRSFVLILHDPDSMRKPDFVHWVVFDIPSSVTELLEGEGNGVGLTGRNDFGEAEYGGPCPAQGEHRYVFDLYALDVETLGLERGATHDDVEAAMEEHLLGRAYLMGRYQRPGSASEQSRLLSFGG